MTTSSGRKRRRELTDPISRYSAGDTCPPATYPVVLGREQIHQQGASQADLDDALAALTDHNRTIIGAPITTAWGQRTS